MTKVGTLKQIKKAVARINNPETWNNTDANWLLNQADLIEERLSNLIQPSGISISAWNNYQDKKDSLIEKLELCR